MAKIKVLDESVKSSSVSSVVKIFESPEFGKVRTVIINDEPWFVGVDVASVLDYKYGSLAKQRGFFLIFVKEKF